MRYLDVYTRKRPGARSAPGFFLAYTLTRPIEEQDREVGEVNLRVTIDVGWRV